MRWSSRSTCSAAAAGMVARTRARPRAVAIKSLRLGVWSTHAPTTSPRRKSGADEAARSRPIWTGVADRLTAASGSATRDTSEPSRDRLWASHSFRKSLTPPVTSSRAGTEGSWSLPGTGCADQRAQVLRLVKRKLAAARRPESRYEPEALVGDGPGELDPFAPQLLHRGVHVVAHQAELMATIVVRGVDAQLGRGQREDQPAVVGVHVREPEHVAKERTDPLRVGRVDQRMNYGNHSAIVAPRVLTRNACSANLRVAPSWPSSHHSTLPSFPAT